MAVPARYRLAEDTGWRDGRAIDASRSGVLFETAEEPAAVDTAVLVRLQLRAAPVPVEVECAGRIVRSEMAADGRRRLAATIEFYQFVSEGQGPGTPRPSDT